MKYDLLNKKINLFTVQAVSSAETKSLLVDASETRWKIVEFE